MIPFKTNIVWQRLTRSRFSLISKLCKRNCLPATEMLQWSHKCLASVQWLLRVEVSIPWKKKVKHQVSKMLLLLETLKRFQRNSRCWTRKQPPNVNTTHSCYRKFLACKETSRSAVVFVQSECMKSRKDTRMLSNPFLRLSWDVTILVHRSGNHLRLTKCGAQTKHNQASFKTWNRLRLVLLMDTMLVFLHTVKQVLVKLTQWRVVLKVVTTVLVTEQSKRFSLF
mmetsp:Transcript_7485/g.10767  ORF Transcript_7485/g.10767 Transcript_7485/m.10767 type:complete len:225 (+) Transcript_7485:1132-1806(+)